MKPLLIKNSIINRVLVLISLLSLDGSLLAEPIDVTYTVDGTSGDWVLDFTVQNNLFSAPDQEIYFFCVELVQQDVTGPAGYGIEGFNPFYFTGSGPNINYDTGWISLINGYPYGIVVGSSLSGFEVTDTDTDAPTSVNWMAYSFGSDPYTGDFGTDTTLGFDGVASPAAVGVPDGGSSLSLLSGALVAIGALARKLRK